VFVPILDPFGVYPILDNMTMSEPHGTLTPGRIIAGRYELTEEVGRGGFGMVWRARQLNMDRDVG
jgi:serine/threonine protein kinase